MDSIVLKNMITCKEGNVKELKKKFTFEMKDKSGRRTYFQCMNTEEVQEWMGIIGLCCESGHPLRGFLHGSPQSQTLREALTPLIGVPLQTLGYLPQPTVVWTTAQIDELLAAVEKVRKGEQSRSDYLLQQGVVAFDVKLPKEFPLCVALSAAFANTGDVSGRLARLSPWKPFCTLLFTGMQNLAKISSSGKIPRDAKALNMDYKEDFCQRDIAVSQEYIHTVLNRKFAEGRKVTFWNPTSVTLNTSISHLHSTRIECPDLKPLITHPIAGFCWLDQVAAQKPTLIRFLFQNAEVRSCLYHWGRGSHDEHILIPPIRCRVIRMFPCDDIVCHNTGKVRSGYVVHLDVLPKPFDY